MPRTLIATLLLAALIGACDKKKKIPPPSDASNNPPAKAAEKKYVPPKAPAEVPAALRDQIGREWPAIEEAGNAFMAKVKEASAARKANDRDKLDAIIKAANAHYINAVEAWNGIYYSVDDLPEETAEAARKYMRRWNKKVDRWMDANKALKEYSRVR